MIKIVTLHPNLKIRMLTTLKDYCVEMRLKKLLAQKKHFEPKTFKNIKNALVILPEDNALKNAVDQIAKVLKIPKNQLISIKISNETGKEKADEYHFSKKDFNFFGKISDETLKNIVKKKYNLLINLNHSLNCYTDYVTLQSKSAFKVGFAKEGIAKIPDLLIKVPPEKIDLFCEEMEKYLRILKIKD